MSIENTIRELMEKLHAEGVAMVELGPIEAKLTTLLYRARRIRNAESMLPLYGADAVAERLGCHRSTVYRLVERGISKRKAENEEQKVA